MLAYVHPQGGIFWTMLELFLFIVWFWIRIAIFSDIFWSRDMGGWANALWVIFVIVLPFLGIPVYLIARGGKMQERSLEQAQRQQEALDAQVGRAAGGETGGASSAGMSTKDGN